MDNRELADKIRLFEGSSEEGKQIQVYRELAILTDLTRKMEDRLRSINLGVGIVASSTFLAFVVWIVTSIVESVMEGL